MIASLVHTLIAEIRSSPARVSDLATFCPDPVVLAGGKRKPTAYRQQVSRLVNRLEAAGVLRSEERSSGRFFHIADENRLSGFVYHYTGADGRVQQELRQKAGRLRRAKVTAPPLCAGAQPGDLVTSMGQPFVCVGARYVTTAKKERKMAIGVWRSCCAYPDCAEPFEQTFSLRFPFGVKVSPLRTCPKHRRLPIEDLAQQFITETDWVEIETEEGIKNRKETTKTFRQFTKFKDFKDYYIDFYNPI